jgi:antitoxin component of RelBE/YafQ-DinJ toxin-antitoxin module
MCDNGRMAATITFRPDEDAARALDVLTRNGTPVSTAVRTALIDAARDRARAKLRAEARALAADEEDRAEAAQVLRDMESLRAW